MLLISPTVAVGFFISNHPLNQFKEIFDDYNIHDYLTFNTNDDLKESNIAATLLKIQERKTAKGNAYAVLKLTDLTSVFELFIFSDTLELNREILKEGNSLILTLVKFAVYINNQITLGIISATMEYDEIIYRNYYNKIDDNYKYPLSVYNKNKMKEGILFNRYFIDKRMIKILRLARQ